MESTHRLASEPLGGVPPSGAPPRRRMPIERRSLTHKFCIEGHEGYLTAGLYDDGTLGELFISDVGKEGSTLRGVFSAWATTLSIALQHGVPLESLVRKFAYTPEAGVRKIRWLAELGVPTIHLSIGAEPLSVEASRVCVLTDPADGLDLIAQHTVDALAAARRRRSAT